LSKAGTIGIWVGVVLLALLAGTQIESALAAAKHGAITGNVRYSCGATLNEASCTATNMNDFEVLGVCISVRLDPRASGTAAEAVPICTGKMGARSTVNVAAHWAKGSAAAACPTDNKFAPLDWNACSLTVAEVKE
jgi:hypothetical protein